MENLPAPSAELELTLACLKVQCAAMAPKQRVVFLRSISDIFEGYEADADVRPMWSRERFAAVRLARREAQAWFRQMLPAFMDPD